MGLLKERGYNKPPVEEKPAPPFPLSMDDVIEIVSLNRVEQQRQEIALAIKGKIEEINDLIIKGMGVGLSVAIFRKTSKKCGITVELSTIRASISHNYNYK